MNPVSLPKVVATIDKFWNPNLVAAVNNHHVKIARVDGDFIWHAHHNSDEFFYLLEGKLEIDLENDDTKSLVPGDVFVVPRGVRHRPRAEKAVLMTMGLDDTVNTGDQVESERTVEIKDARHL